ncbi:MAG: TIGR01777 family oxidoreductase [Flavobacteriales bacterium]
MSNHSTEQGQHHSTIEGNLQITPRTILIAGGSGLIGQRLKKLLTQKGHQVLILTRNPKAATDVYWDPQAKEIAIDQLQQVAAIINLCGESIGTKRWTAQRKKALIQSRVEPTLFLAEIAAQLPKLQHYIGASGVNCYAAETGVVYHESAPYGSDFLSNVVEQWEAAHHVILKNTHGCILRIAMVLASEGGALLTIKRPIQMGFGSAIGSGQQMCPWIHIDDLCQLMIFAFEQQLSGTFNALASNQSNLEMTQYIAKILKKPLWAPAVPAFALKMLLGERAFLVLTDLKASNQKILDAGFAFQYHSLENALKTLLTKS